MESGNWRSNLSIILLESRAVTKALQGFSLPQDRSLNPDITKHLLYLWDSPHVDLFATKWNTKL